MKYNNLVDGGKSILGQCVVSKNILSGAGYLKFAVKNNDFWVFMSNIDPDNYFDNVDNFEYRSFEEIITIEPAIMGLSRMPNGTDIQLCITEAKYYINPFKKNVQYKMWWADTPSGNDDEIKINDDYVDYDGGALRVWLDQLKGNKN